MGKAHPLSPCFPSIARYTKQEQPFNSTSCPKAHSIAYITRACGAQSKDLRVWCAVPSGALSAITMPYLRSKNYRKI